MRLYLKNQPKKQALAVKCVVIFGKITNAKEKLCFARCDICHCGAEMAFEDDNIRA